ncbi:hypothetical protein LTS15_005168 [Exophiala xenobiotica]|nr:hypothetical protein LTS15_005168 [Exophiala xenobiotica]
MPSSAKVKESKGLKTFSASEVVNHRRKEDLGGQEVLVDQGGHDATEAFEEVGHSQDARQQLTELMIGSLSRQVGDEKLLASSGNAYRSYHANSPTSALSTCARIMLVLVVAIAVFFGWHFLLS